MISVVADTGRMKRESAPTLVYLNLRDGLAVRYCRGRRGAALIGIVRQANFS